MMEAPSVAAVVVNYQTAHLLPDCVLSLQRQSGLHVATLVVDSHSVDGSADVARSLGVPYLALPSNLGLATAYQAGVEATESEFVFFVNADTAFAPDCVARLVATMSDSPRVFAADPTQLSWDARRVVHGCTVLRRVGLARSFAPIPGVAPQYRMHAEGSTSVPWGCGGSLLVRRSLLDELGGWDTAFFLDNEDVDLCWRAWLRGWPTVHVPAARLRHRVGASTTIANRRRSARLRRLVSQFHNGQRVAAKLFGERMLVLTMVVQAVRAGRYTVAGDSLALAAWVRAVQATARDRSHLLRQRRTLLRGRVVSSQTLLEHFLSGREPLRLSASTLDERLPMRSGRRHA